MSDQGEEKQRGVRGAVGMVHTLHMPYLKVAAVIPTRHENGEVATLTVAFYLQSEKQLDPLNLFMLNKQATVNRKNASVVGRLTLEYHAEKD